LQNNKLISFGDFFKTENTNIRILCMGTVRKDCSAVGRMNYLFTGSHRGGELAAIIYSLMATCKLQNIDPATWLEDVLSRIPVQPEDKLIELLPQFWKPRSKVKQVTA
jgi:hypothetical protein